MKIDIRKMARLLTLVASTTALALLAFTAPVAAQGQGYQEGEPCNDDTQCRDLLSCTGGVCTVECTTSADCAPGQRCHLNGCVQCVNNSHCGVGVCTNFVCQGCANDSQCGSKEICHNNACAAVECTGDQHCGFGEMCSADHTCVSKCPSGQKWVSAPGFPVCTACIPSSRRSDCMNLGDCSIDRVCAGGHCIPRCGVPPDVARLERELERMRHVVIVVPDPGCRRRCSYTFDLDPVRRAVEAGKLRDPLVMKLRDAGGRVVADLGQFAPSGSRYPSIKSAIQVTAPGRLTTDDCGYRLEITSSQGQAVAEVGGLCLEAR